MGKRTRRNHSLAVKAKEAVLALQGDLTTAALANKFTIQPNLIAHWKTQLLENAAAAFGDGGKDEEVNDF